MSTMSKVYILFDGRAASGDTDDAAVLCTARTLKEARRDARMFGHCVIYEYDLSADGKEATNETFIEERNA